MPFFANTKLYHLVMCICLLQDTTFSMQDESLPLALLALTPVGFGAIDDAFHAAMDFYAHTAIRDLRRGLKHQSLHCISFGYSMHTVIGLSLESFGKLFSFLLENRV